jgi:hypothetical protein
MIDTRRDGLFLLAIHRFGNRFEFDTFRGLCEQKQRWEHEGFIGKEDGREELLTRLTIVLHTQAVSIVTVRQSRDTECVETFLFSQSKTATADDMLAFTEQEEGGEDL